MSDPVAMHMSDGLINAPVSALFGAVAVLGVTFVAMRARRDLDERTAPMAGLVAAFIFAVQMLNFPVLPGVSGHLLGGALAAILVGPWVGALCITTVLVVQSLVFADGGLTALGANITNMALIGTAAGYLIALALRPLAVRSRPGLITTAVLAGFFGTVAASLGFVLEFALGGDAAFSLGAVSVTVLGVHCLIGIGEGVITALTVGAVASVRPDLVRLLRGTAPQLELRDTPVLEGQR
ncbi:energy-coupling factor ABC transporter permease [Actinophytocola sp.]|uniref:energy-coupling factor ABC transporter permease n=1 Tax=Actinophytocola sp. TaxID=1872138 RepID=UPI002D7FA71C|nr:energy-coupling factor ABC transporter permease [Actinophytocola sp.]HET9143908.1 energy-coupling factor ABC transporter permease [Actinophytocola sp.]